MTPKQLRKHRTALGLTQKQLGAKLDRTVKMVNNYEGGRSPIPLVIELSMQTLGEK